ncbi:hypothetical protein SLEP1_g36167 [Rubroshorea leprosula]|uniref:Uncharacterized protein n=1 Tax=Rubroshorea leprosula TaxID=152421 RepID=A0AAV5KQW6_9ROSI|nr:hypothetical protein SLEP1_g36167 [Rubroshorea leprosula]
MQEKAVALQHASDVQSGTITENFLRFLPPFSFSSATSGHEAIQKKSYLP